MDAQGRVSGWLNELAFAAVDLGEMAPRDPWSGDTGVGGQYFSQDAVIRLAAAAGVPTDAALPPAQQLRQVQELARAGPSRCPEDLPGYGGVPCPYAGPVC